MNTDLVVQEELIEEVDLLESTFDYESWAINMEAGLTYKGKSIDQWSKELAINIKDVDYTLDEIEKLNYKALTIIEIVMTNVSLTKATFFASKAQHALALQKARTTVLKDLAVTGKKPGQEAIEKLCLDKCNKTWRLQFMSEIIFEFWNTQSFKLNQINSRLTSLNIIKNIESRTTSGY